jgi:hypothetical protein
MTTEHDVGDLDVYGIAERLFPYDGPYNPERTTAAAALLSRLVRYLNNATTKHDAVVHASDIGSVVASLAAVDHGRDQLQRQLLERLHRFAQDPLLYDDRRDRAGAVTAVEAGAWLRESGEATAASGGCLDAASRELSHLGHDDPPVA